MAKWRGRVEFSKIDVGDWADGKDFHRLGNVEK